MSNVQPNHLREDIEEQFELPDLPTPATVNRAKDLRACKNCQRKPCGWCERTIN